MRERSFEATRPLPGVVRRPIADDASCVGREKSLSALRLRSMGSAIFAAHAAAQIEGTRACDAR
jgi:hypothetical protein